MYPLGVLDETWTSVYSDMNERMLRTQSDEMGDELKSEKHRSVLKDESSV